MPRDGAIVFGDLIGKLDMLRVSCEKCGRDGRYGLAKLIDKRGRDGKLVDWLDELTADCPKKRGEVSAITEGAVRFNYAPQTSQCTSRICIWRIQSFRRCRFNNSTSTSNFRGSRYDVGNVAVGHMVLSPLWVMWHSTG
jgi:hypothetical protein